MYKLLIQSVVYPFTPYAQPASSAVLRTDVVEFDFYDVAEEAADQIQSTPIDKCSSGMLLTRVIKLYKPN